MKLLLLQVRFFRNWKALLVLIWTLFAFAIVTSPIFLNISSRPYVILISLWFPIAGCLSDVLIWRYTVIHYSLRLVWLLIVLYNIALLLQQYVELFLQPLNYIENVVSTLTAVGMAGMWTNTFQFGIDQLTDASSSEITSYISWYVWTFCVALAVFPLLQACTCLEYNSPISFYILPLLGTFVLVTDCLFNKSLIKEPPTHNPFKLIYQVLKYAATHKYPQMRSAFTYWEDIPYSRIDLGKNKYGGPFTTEQVEDVKTFFRLVMVILVSSLYIGIVYVLYSSFHDFNGFFSEEFIIQTCVETSRTKYFLHCFLQTLLRYLAPTLIVFMIPTFELFLYPLLMQCHCTAKLKIKHKLIIGAVLLVLYESGVLAFEMTAVFMDTDVQNSTCILYEYYNEDTKVDYKWLASLQPFLGAAIYILLSSNLELLCAQSPYSMKGILVGLFYSVGAITAFISDGLMRLIQPSMKSSQRNCLMWLFTAVLCLTVVLVSIQFISLKCYKLRKREDTLRNDQMFAVD